ncbi:MAG: hypothetical protein ACFFG0_01795 [Candidatus Thorarchaeota archaeon]
MFYIANNDHKTTYLTADYFEKESKKIIPHHLIEGPCRDCIVRSICDEFCYFLEKYYFSSSTLEKEQMSNYFEKFNSYRIKIGYSKNSKKILYYKHLK